MKNKSHESAQRSKPSHMTRFSPSAGSNRQTPQLFFDFDLHVVNGCELVSVRKFRELLREHVLGWRLASDCVVE